MKETKTWGIASLTTGILSILLVLMPYFALPLSVFAIVAASMQKPKNGMATAGLVIGILGTILNSITMLIFLFMLLMGIGMS